VLNSGGSFKLATIAGIRVGVSASWFLILFLYIFWFQDQFTQILTDKTLGFTTAVLTALGFFGSILLHELGHAFAARREGIGVPSIELFMFGGFTRMDRAPDSPGQEFRIAVAGPLVTLLIAAVGFVVGVLLMGFPEFSDAALLRGNAPSNVFDLWLSFMVSINLLLLVFNLVPAFPLDGGRLAQAAAWKGTGDRHRATRFAATLGIGFAALLIGYGAYRLLSVSDSFGGLWYIVLGWMLGSSARAALAQSAFTSRIEGITVAEVMDDEPVTIPADLTVVRAWDEFFLRYSDWPWFAVVEADGRWAGIAHRAAVEQVAHSPDAAMLTVRRVATAAEEDVRIATDAPLEALLGAEALSRLGGLVATDADGRVRGIVTRDAAVRALHARLAPS
jgi:Zn-dependent protease